MSKPSQADIDIARDWCSVNLPENISGQEFDQKVQEVAYENANSLHLPLEPNDYIIFVSI